MNAIVLSLQEKMRDNWAYRKELWNATEILGSKSSILIAYIVPFVQWQDKNDLLLFRL